MVGGKGVAANAATPYRWRNSGSLTDICSVDSVFTLSSGVICLKKKGTQGLRALIVGGQEEPGSS